MLQELPFIDEPERLTAHQDGVEPGADGVPASGQVSFADRPSATGCLPPSMGVNALL